MHSEQRLIAWDARMQRLGREVQVLRVYSDRVHFGPYRANCSGLLSHRYGTGLDVYFNQRPRRRGRGGC